MTEPDAPLAGPISATRLGLVIALVMTLLPGNPLAVTLLMVVVLIGTLTVSAWWQVDRAALAVLVVLGLVLRLGVIDQIGSDVLTVTGAAIQRTFAGQNPYGVAYDVSNPPGAPFPYGPLTLLWYLPFLAEPRRLEFIVAAVVLVILAVQGRTIGLALYASAPALAALTSDGSNDTSVGLLLLLTFAVAARRPVLGAVGLALAIALKPYALAWAPGFLLWGGGSVAIAFVATTLVVWSPVLLLWGPGSFIRSVQMAGEVHGAPYISLGVIWEGFLKSAAPGPFLDQAKLVLGGLTAAVTLRFARSLDGVILAGVLVFLVTLYSGYWATYAYLSAIAPVLCWRVDDWLGLPTRPLELLRRQSLSAQVSSPG